jgi:hypothetical protein
LNSLPAKSNRRFVVIMICSFMLGMGVGLAVYFFWRAHAAYLRPASNSMVLVVCPPFILSYAIGPVPDSAFSAVLGVGTIVLANGFLYAGVTAGIYAMRKLPRKRG